MNLIDESNKESKNSKKILLICSAGIVVSLIIIITLLVYLTTAGKSSITLSIDGKKYEASSYLLNKDDVFYIGIEDLTKVIPMNGYDYKSGSKDVEDENKCYIINSYESTFFEVGSNKITKISEDTKETQYYTLENDVIKENNKIYISLNSAEIATNCKVTIDNNKIQMYSIGYIEGVYNQEKSTTFTPDESIVWETTFANKKLLKDNLVIIKDESNRLGIAKVSSKSQKGKNKLTITTVTTQAIITPKYKDIEYVEKFNQLIVTTESGKGIIQLENNDGNFSVETKVTPQYEEINPISKELFVISEDLNKQNSNQSTSNSTNSTGSSTQSSSEKNKKYGIIGENGTVILQAKYDAIGIDTSKFTNNDLDSKYIIYDSLIPVKSGNLWGFVNLSGSVITKVEYTGLGYSSTNSSSNVLIVPELKAIVVRKDNKYGIIDKSGKVLIKTQLDKVYKENVNGKEIYSFEYGGKKQNLVDYINMGNFDDTTDTNSDKNKNTNTNANTNSNTNNSSNSVTINNKSNTN